MANIKTKFDIGDVVYYTNPHTRKSAGIITKIEVVVLEGRTSIKYTLNNNEEKYEQALTYVGDIK